MSDSQWQLRDSQGSDAIPEELSASHREIINHELCGRADTNHTFRDLRSAAIARRRDRSDREKYYNYRGVNRGQLSRLHFRYDAISHNPNHGPIAVIRSLLPDCMVEPMSKRQFYQEAQQYPRPPTYHRSRRRFDDCCSILTWTKGKVERKHGRSWMNRDAVEAWDVDPHYSVIAHESIQNRSDQHIEISNQIPGPKGDCCLDHTGADIMLCSSGASSGPVLSYIEAVSLVDKEFLWTKRVGSQSQSMVESHALPIPLRSRSESRLRKQSNEDDDGFIWVRAEDASEDNDWEVISCTSEP
nr:hypothetical protein CFP56_34694 [Quercus suber]